MRLFRSCLRPSCTNRGTVDGNDFVEPQPHSHREVADPVPQADWREEIENAAVCTVGQAEANGPPTATPGKIVL